MSEEEEEEGATNTECWLVEKKTCKAKSISPLPECFGCVEKDCENFMHTSCSRLLLDRYSVPQEDRPDEVQEYKVVFCKKTCYNKWIAAKRREAKKKKKEEKEAAKLSKKKRQTWEENGTLAVLLDWLTTEPNYSKMCGGDENDGKRRTDYYKELAQIINQKVPGANKSAKDVENKIYNLESSWKKAHDWANQTGVGARERSEEEFKAAVLQRCSLYYELEDIMVDRPNAEPLCTNMDSSCSEDSSVPPAEGGSEDNGSESESDDDDGDDGLEEPVGVEEAMARDRARNTVAAMPPLPTTVAPAGAAVLTPTLGTPIVATPDAVPRTPKQKGSTKKKRLTAKSGTKNGKGKGNKDADDLVTNIFGDETVASRNAASKEKEAAARLMEATANSRKTDEERKILVAAAANGEAKARIELESMEVDLLEKKLLKRQKLLESGAATEELLDRILPIPKPKQN